MGRGDLVFFLSGAAALAYEVLWARSVSRTLGADAAGAALVLALFMGGLGLGAWLAAQPAARSTRPRGTFAALELAIAIWAALSPFALERMGVEGSLTVRAMRVALVLLPPTLAMGATFPFMGRLAIGARSSAAGETAGFYGANTLGACAGALLAPLVLLPLFGLTYGLSAAAVLDVAAAALAMSLVVPGREVRTRAPGSGILPVRLAAATALLGAASLALEVLFTRLLVNVTGATIYAFAIVLAVFLLGIGLGSRGSRKALQQSSNPALELARCAAWAPALALGGLLVLRWQLGERDLFGVLANRQPSGANTWRLWLFNVIVAAVALLPMTFAFGRALPATVAAALRARPLADPEALLGSVYLANTLGALAGSLAGGFALLAWTGPRLGVVIALAPCLLAALLVPSVPRRAAWWGAAVALALGSFALRRPPATSGNAQLALYVGRNATVGVEETVEGDGARVRSLRVNGKVEATTAPVDMRLQRLLGHIPGLLHGNVRSALVIGLGTGMTAGSLRDLPTLEQLTIFEIEAVVPRAARAFGEWNGHLLDDPRVRVELADGRLALARSSARFDLITADPLHPATRGSSDLFSLEHFQSMAAHLAPGGVASQWLPLYELSTLDVRTVIATWVAAFPYTSAWLTAYDLALVGSNEPLHGSLDALPPTVAAALSGVGVHDALDLQALLVARDEELRAYCSGVEPMKLDRPILELRAPFSFLAGYSREVLAWAGRPEFVETLPASVRPRALRQRTLLARFLADLPTGWSAAAGAYGRALLAPP
jgi:spermidine synthase